MRTIPALQLTRRHLWPLQLQLVPSFVVFFRVLLFQLKFSSCSGWTCSTLFAVVVSKPTARLYEGERLCFRHGQQHKQRCRSPLFVSSTSSADDDQNNAVVADADPRNEFLDAMERFKFATHGDDGEFQKQETKKPQQHDPLMGYRPEQLEAYAESLLSRSSPLRRDGNDSTGISNNTKTDLLLNANVYDRSRDNLNQDDSIRQQHADLDFGYDISQTSDESLLNDSTVMDEKYREAMQNYLEMVVTTQAPEAYESFSDSVSSAKTVEELWTFLRQHGAPTFDPVAAEALHRQVFLEEEGHLQQSEEFRASLIDSTAAQQVLAERRGRNYRERQEEVLRDLDQQIREFEATTLPKLRPSAPALPAAGRAKQHVQSSRRDGDGEYAKQPARQPPSTTSTSSHKSVKYPANRPSVKDTATSSFLQHPRQQQQQSPIPHASVPSSAMRANRTMPPTLQQQQQRPNLGSVQQRIVTNKNNTTDTPTATLDASHTLQGRGPWRAVEDPDTNEVFYWNEETEEMRW